jgi:hypothetical protein
VIRRLIQRLRSRYTLHYAMPGGKPGKAREIKVELHARRHGDFPAHGCTRVPATTWTLNAEGNVMSMVLTQNGKTLGGTLDSPHGPIALKGEIVDGTLTFKGSGGDAHPLEFTFKGALKSDGTLAGNLTSNVGDMNWTAVREAKR